MRKLSLSFLSLRCDEAMSTTTKKTKETKEITMAKVRVTQIKGRSGATKKQIANLESLGIRKIHHSVEVELNPVVKGMIEKVRHLVTIEEIK